LATALRSSEAHARDMADTNSPAANNRLSNQRRTFAAKMWHPITAPRRSLAMRVTLVFGLLSLLLVTTMGLSIYLLTARYLNDQAEDSLATLADFYAIYTASTAPDESRLAALAPQITSFFAPQAGYDVRLFSSRNGALLAATRDIGPLPSSSARAELGIRRPSLFLAASQDQPGRLYAARPVRLADGTLLAVVEVSRDVSDIESFLSILHLVLIGAGGGALIAAMIASLLLARQMTRPLREMESATQAIAAGDFDRRLGVTSKDEIGRLADSINHMAAELSRLETVRREFIAKISHDLRTPLTAIKGFVVNLQDTAPHEMQPALATIDEQTDRLIRLVNDLLTLSRLQRGELHLRRTETNLVAVVRSAAALAEAKAQRLGASLVLDLADDLPSAPADADRLQQVIVNLLDNALKATPAGGTVRIQARGNKKEVTVTVLDEGQGLTPEQAARAFEPYYSGPGGGAGLGLTIAREIIDAHDGQIWLKPRPEGGAEAGFTLPR
jgi:signal transduction histidine kinase